MKIPRRLAQGYAKFRREQFCSEVERYASVGLNKKSETMIIACADARVDPATVFQTAPGELFVVRNVAALVPPYETVGSYHGTSAAIEFAVKELAVKSIIVLGHAQCGGVAASLKAAQDAKQPSHFMGPWLALIDGVRDELFRSRPDETQMELQRVLEELAVKQSVFNISTFPFVADAVTRGALEVHGAWLSMGRGELRWLNDASGEFEVVPTIALRHRSEH